MKTKKITIEKLQRIINSASTLGELRFLSNLLNHLDETGFITITKDEYLSLYKGGSISVDKYLKRLCAKKIIKTNVGNIMVLNEDIFAL